jgi:ribosomal protein L27
MAHKKGQGSSRNGRDSNSQRLGVKRHDGNIVTAARSWSSEGRRFEPGLNVGLGKDTRSSRRSTARSASKTTAARRRNQRDSSRRASLRIARCSSTKSTFTSCRRRRQRLPELPPRKVRPARRPDGGTAAHGGSVYIVATPAKNTLVDFRFHPEFEARRGQHGQGSNRTGRRRTISRSGADRHARFEKDAETASSAARRSRGKASACSSPRRARRPRQRALRLVHQSRAAPDRAGRSGRRKALRLQLKLIADVGLIGFPNAGKSTLISGSPRRVPRSPITRSPRFTQSGVVTLSDDRSFVVADVPG